MRCLTLVILALVVAVMLPPEHVGPNSACPEQVGNHCWLPAEHVGSGNYAFA